MAGYWFAGWLCARSLAINHLVFLCAADQTAAGASTSMHQNTHKFIIYTHTHTHTHTHERIEANHHPI